MRTNEIDWLSPVLDCSNALQWSAPEINTLALLEREKARQEVWEREIWETFREERVVVGTCMQILAQSVDVFGSSSCPCIQNVWQGSAACHCYDSAKSSLQIELFIGGANVSIVWSLEVRLSASLFSYLKLYSPFIFSPNVWCFCAFSPTQFHHDPRNCRRF